MTLDDAARAPLDARAAAAAGGPGAWPQGRPEEMRVPRRLTWDFGFLQDPEDIEDFDHQKILTQLPV